MYTVDNLDNRLTYIIDWIDENVKHSHRVVHDGYATSIWFYDAGDRQMFVERWMTE
jgi:hypothetical protein